MVAIIQRYQHFPSHVVCKRSDRISWVEFYLEGLYSKIHAAKIQAACEAVHAANIQATIEAEKCKEALTMLSQFEVPEEQTEQMELIDSMQAEVYKNAIEAVWVRDAALNHWK